MNYKTGDEVVCVDTNDCETLKEGQTYVVALLVDDCVALVGDVERPITECGDCGLSDRFVHHFWPWQFTKPERLLKLERTDRPTRILRKETAPA